MLGTGWAFHLPGTHTKQAGPSLCPAGQTSEPYLRGKAGKSGDGERQKDRKTKDEGERCYNFPTPRLEAFPDFTTAVCLGHMKP